MARGRRKKEHVERTIKMNAGDFRKAVEEAHRLKDQTASYSGFLGQHTKAFVEKTGYSRQAFAFMVKLERLGDDLKRQSLMDEIVMGFEMMGWNDQGNLFDRVKTRMDNQIEPDKDEADEEDVRPAFLKQNSMPLDEAEAAFEKTAHLAPQPDALSALAGEDDGFGAATQEVLGEAETIEAGPATVEVTKAGRRQRVSRAEVEATAKAGRAEVRGIGDVVLN